MVRRRAATSIASPPITRPNSSSNDREMLAPVPAVPPPEDTAATVSVVRATAASPFASVPRASMVCVPSDVLLGIVTDFENDPFAPTVAWPSETTCVNRLSVTVDPASQLSPVRRSCPPGDTVDALAPTVDCTGG